MSKSSDDSHISKKVFLERLIPDSTSKNVHYASVGNSHFYILVSLFCVILVLSNISATKAIEFFGLPFDGGMFLFPLAYVLGDIFAEVYGFKSARKAILMGFASTILATLTFWLVIIAPPANFYENQNAFESVLGPVPLIVIGSLLGYLVGQFINSSVLTWIKKHTLEDKLWVRLLGSTGLGELADTIIFCSFAAPVIGIKTWSDYFSYVIVGYIFKILVEVVLLPVSYWIIAWIKKHEPSYGANSSQ